MWESSVLNCLGFIHVGNRAAFFPNTNLSSVFIAEHSNHCHEQWGEKHTSQQERVLTLFLFFFSPSRLQNTSWQLCPWQVQSLEEWWGVLLVSLQASKWQELQLHLVVGFWVSQVENWYKEENRNRSSRSLAAVQSFLAKVPKNPAEV